MRRGVILQKVSFMILATLLLNQPGLGSGQEKRKMTRDEVYHTVARGVNLQSESPVTDIIGALDEVIEVKEVVISPENGKATALVRERTESSAAHTNKEIRLVFAPEGAHWKWESFENDRKLYPVEKLFPYARSEIGRYKQAVEAQWKATLEAMTKQADSAFKLLETAKAILKAEPAPLGHLTTARQALAEAIKQNDPDAIRSAYREINQLSEPVTSLSDQHQELKANDAYLRLQDEFQAAQKVLEGARQNYLNAVKAYNDFIVRLPFALVAYGLGFMKVEPQIEVD